MSPYHLDVAPMNSCDHDDKGDALEKASETRNDLIEPGHLATSCYLWIITKEKSAPATLCKLLCHSPLLLPSLTHSSQQKSC